jgi:hypothetical protein
MIIRNQSKGIRITKIVGADLPLETEKRCGCCRSGFYLMRLKQILVLISKSIKHKSRSGIGSSAIVQQEQFMESMPYWEPI